VDDPSSAIAVTENSVEQARPGARVRILRNAIEPWAGHGGMVVWTSGQSCPIVYAVRFDNPALRTAVFAASEIEVITAT
jgi:hypothetical protein